MFNRLEALIDMMQSRTRHNHSKSFSFQNFYFLSVSVVMLVMFIFREILKNGSDQEEDANAQGRQGRRP